ncbi:uncharacterized protein GLRG_11997 [Colletotrichum graminicola M1.001]|uniref:Uncharacterized protein n=1 Tax=Colletotrichum graminicola (strain M1.001 / M2 / FGSC 10212) TaxID=645133 RepID=E3R163_COLGM|nr:uncharacterized protein GLRG_11997 [Colletotrichum graminicola M1.001]EFQ36851.1 hypothetical protein GLRG_11997 [Colletotrichum graminicola M1.001]
MARMALQPYPLFVNVRAYNGFSVTRDGFINVMACSSFVNIVAYNGFINVVAHSGFVNVVAYNGFVNVVACGGFINVTLRDPSLQSSHKGV